MFILNPLFWIIIGLGLAIPSTLTIIINISIKLKAGDQYHLSLIALFKVYLVALLGWAIFSCEVIS